jgi:hypothetical protein
VAYGKLHCWMTQDGRAHSMLVVACLALLVTLLWAPPVASAFAGACGTSTVARDFLAQVKRAAPIEKVPPSGELPFARAELHLESPGGDLNIESGSVGFRLENRLAGTRQIGWIVESELTQVTARGKDVRDLGIRRRKVGSLAADAGFSLPHRISATPAYYRVDIRFRGKDGSRQAGHYGFYTRVMKPRVDLRARIDDYTVAPGEVASAVLLDLGTVLLVTPSYD